MGYHAPKRKPYTVWLLSDRLLLTRPDALTRNSMAVHLKLKDDLPFGRLKLSTAMPPTPSQQKQTAPPPSPGPPPGGADAAGRTPLASVDDPASFWVRLDETMPDEPPTAAAAAAGGGGAPPAPKPWYQIHVEDAWSVRQLMTALEAACEAHGLAEKEQHEVIARRAAQAASPQRGPRGAARGKGDAEARSTAAGGFESAAAGGGGVVGGGGHNNELNPDGTLRKRGRRGALGVVDAGGGLGGEAAVSLVAGAVSIGRRASLSLPLPRAAGPRAAARAGTGPRRGSLAATLNIANLWSKKPADAGGGGSFSLDPGGAGSSSLTTGSSELGAASATASDTLPAALAMEEGRAQGGTCNGEGAASSGGDPDLPAMRLAAISERRTSGSGSGDSGSGGIGSGGGGGGAGPPPSLSGGAAAALRKESLACDALAPVPHVHSPRVHQLPSMPGFDSARSNWLSQRISVAPGSVDGVERRGSDDWGDSVRGSAASDGPPACLASMSSDEIDLSFASGRSAAWGSGDSLGCSESGSQGGSQGGGSQGGGSQGGGSQGGGVRKTVRIAEDEPGTARAPARLADFGSLPSPVASEVERRVTLARRTSLESGSDAGSESIAIESHIAHMRTIAALRKSNRAPSSAGEWSDDDNDDDDDDNSFGLDDSSDIEDQ